MAFDGILLRALRNEIASALLGARISKIAQPEKEEILLTLKTETGQVRLLLSGSASLPFVCLTEENKPSPMTAPGFTMLLRKHLGGGRILSVQQPGLERVLDLAVEAPDEMGDLKEKHLIVEIMGKYSNIILTDGNRMILDAVRRVPPAVSSVRTVLPGKEYFIPETQNKADLLSCPREDFLNRLQDTDTLAGAFSKHYTGISVQSAEEFLFRTGWDSSRSVSSLSSVEKEQFADTAAALCREISEGLFQPAIAYENGEPKAYSALGLPSYEAGNNRNVRVEHFDSPSRMVRAYLSDKDTSVNMRQRSSDLRKIIQNLIERASKKLDLQVSQMRDTEKMEKLKLYGELLNAYSYTMSPGQKSVTVLNYYTNEEMTVPTDPALTIADNAKKYFDRYGKLKRTARALETLIPQTEAELSHLKGILVSLDICTDQEALSEIREEMAESGYVRQKTGKKDRRGKTGFVPYHYRSSDGFDIYVGKNNLQNDRLTFRFAEGNDIFMHAKQMPGSHVIIRTEGREVPDRTYEEGGALAAYYSAGRDSEKVEIDYVVKKEVKKPAGAKPGFVVYYTNYSLVAVPDITGIERIK